MDYHLGGSAEGDNPGKVRFWESGGDLFSKPLPSEGRGLENALKREGEQGINLVYGDSPYY